MQTKHTATFSVDKNILIEFNDMTFEKCINKSQLVESLLRKWINDNKENCDSLSNNKQD